MIYCKPFVPRTPQKEANKSAENESSPATRKETNEKKNEEGVKTAPKQVIPGLPEKDRLKAQTIKEKKDKKEKPRKPKPGKNKTKEDYTDVETLTVKHFLKKPEESLEDFEFSDHGSSGDDDDDAFEDSKEEVEDPNVFSTPLAFKSTFGVSVARSESRPRSRSVSTKRLYESSDPDEENKKKKGSGFPAFRKTKAAKSSSEIPALSKIKAANSTPEL